MNGRPWGLGIHAILYFVSVFPLGFAYVAAICLCYLSHPQWKIFHFCAMPGRMALTNYTDQSVSGMLLFYGIGFGFGAGARAGLCRADCRNGMDCTGIVQRYMAALFPIRTVGVDLADADLWESIQTR